MSILSLSQSPASPRIPDRLWVFESVLGVGSVERLPAGYDVDGLCCLMTYNTRLPTRCYPKLIETSTGHNTGEIII